METTVSKEELFFMIKQAVRDVLREEKADIILNSLPAVQENEMHDIEKDYGSPEKTIKIVNTEYLEI